MDVAQSTKSNNADRSNLCPAKQPKIKVSANTSYNIKWNVLYVLYFWSQSKRINTSFCYVVLSMIKKDIVWDFAFSTCDVILTGSI